MVGQGKAVKVKMLFFGPLADQAEASARSRLLWSTGRQAIS
jgi:hypothetical protein